MKLQYGILGMVLVSGGAFAHDESAEGIQVGGYVDARYTWQNEKSGARQNSFSLPEGAIYAGKRVGGTRVFIDAGFAVPATTTGAETVTPGSFNVNQAYVSSASDSGFSWKGGRFDGIFGWVANDSSHYQLSTRGIIQNGVNVAGTAKAALPGTHGGLLFGYNFSDMLSLHLLVDAESAVQGNGSGLYSQNLDEPQWGFKLESKMDAFDLGLGFRIEKSDVSTDNAWGLDLVAGTKFADYDFKAIYVMDKDGEADATMGFGAQVGGAVTDAVNAALRVEWSKYAVDSTALAVTVGPQFTIEKGFVVKADYTLTSFGGDANANAETGHAVNLAAVYDF